MSLSSQGWLRPSFHPGLTVGFLPSLSLKPRKMVIISSQMSILLFPAVESIQLFQKHPPPSILFNKDEPQLQWGCEEGFLPSSAVAPWKGDDHKVKHHQVFVLKMSSTDVCHQLVFDPLISRPNGSRGYMWLVSVVPAPSLWMRCMLLRLFCCGLARRGLVRVVCKMSVAERNFPSVKMRNTTLKSEE